MTSTTASVAAAAPQNPIAGVDIAKLLRSTGPVVKCVVLRTGNDEKTHDAKKQSSKAADDPLNSHLVEEIEIDTTPKKNEVEKALGGPFTFIGQYEEEGIMLMARRDNHNAEEEESEDETDDSSNWNPHKLQPPFENLKIRGDILIMKVAEVDDPLDEPGADASAAAAPIPNDEFFLPYSKEEWLRFAARTDYVPPELPEEEEEEESEAEEDCEQEDEGDWSGDDDEEEDDDDIDEEKAKGAMLNLVLSTCLKKFREDNGRGPSTEELCVLKMTVANKLGMDLPEMEAQENEEPDSEKHEDEDEEASEENDKKRASEDPQAKDNAKKVKFGTEEASEPPKEAENGKPIAVH
jgi:hypothetical protein